MVLALRVVRAPQDLPAMHAFGSPGAVKFEIVSFVYEASSQVIRTV